MDQQKDALVQRLEGRTMPWALRAWILHRMGYTNRGRHWHPGPGTPPWTPPPQRKKPS